MQTDEKYVFSAKTMYNVIRKYYPVDKIQFPSRRNYLQHLLNTIPLLKNIDKNEFEKEELLLKDLWNHEIQKIKNKMF